MFQTPILFIIYKNPEVTKVVFDRIREIKPAFIYISADGAKTSNPEDLMEIEETRRVTENIDWDCKVLRRYSETNLGCKIGVSTAISWLFEHEEKGIILEYDCLPSMQFFPFCEELLEKYKDEKLISSITGNNFDSLTGEKQVIDNPNLGESYCYSALAKIWGWATWKRAWEEFDINLTSFEEFEKTNGIEHQIKSDKDQKYWLGKIKDVYTNRNKTTWGFIWVYTHLVNRSFCITPAVNLVTNIGFSENGTHAQNGDNMLANIPMGTLGKALRSPDKIQVCELSDRRFTNALMKAERKDSTIRFLKSLVPELVVKFFFAARSLLIRHNIIKYKKGWQS